MYGDLIHYPNGTVAIYDNTKGWLETAILVNPETVSQYVTSYFSPDEQEVYVGDRVWVEYDPRVTDSESFAGTVIETYHGDYSISKDNGGTYSVEFSGSAVLEKRVIGHIWEKEIV